MRKLFFSCAAAALTAGPSFAQEAEPLVLDEIVVGGGLTPVDAQSFARAATIFTRADIEAARVDSFADLLRLAPGVQVSRTGSIGGGDAVRIRGGEANHVLVLIDGIELARDAAGFDFSHLDLASIERIEILRGPQSALYGPGATSGVVNILTREGSRTGTISQASIEGITAPGVAASASVRSGDRKGDVALSASYREDQGHDVSGERGEKDGARRLTLHFGGTLDASDELRLRATARLADRKSEFDATDFGCGDSDCYVVDEDANEREGLDLAFGLKGEWTPGDGAFVHRPQIGFSMSDDDIETAGGPSSSEDSVFEAGYTVGYSFGENALTTVVGGLEFRREGFSSSFAGGDDKERDAYAAVIDLQSDLSEALFVQLGARYDVNDDFDDAIAWSASASYSLFETGAKLKVSAGQSQTNPTFFEQFGFIPGTFTPNPDLEPERNLGGDIAIEQSFWDERGTIEVGYFREQLTDEIVGAGGTVENSPGESDRQGVEVALSINPVDALRLGASYTFLDAEDADGLAETRRPEHSATLSADARLLDGALELGGELVYTGESKQRDFGDASFASPVVDVSDFLLVNVRAGYALTDGVELWGAVQNLLDEEYQEVLGFRGRPITAQLGVRARW